MKLNFSQLSTSFWGEGYCVIDGFFPVGLVEGWRVIIEDLSNQKNREGVNHIHKIFDKPDLDTLDGAGEYKFSSVDGRILFKMLPNLDGYYHSISNFLSILTGLDIVPSTDKQSSITAMIYKPPGGNLLWHHDSDKLTWLLYFTDNNEGGTEMLPLTAKQPTILGEPDKIVGETVTILPKIGRCVAFQGQKIWHRSLPVENSMKISSVWNFYEHGEQWRPDSISKRLYS